MVLLSGQVHCFVPCARTQSITSCLSSAATEESSAELSTHSPAATVDSSTGSNIPEKLMALPSHSHEGVESTLRETENILRSLHESTWLRDMKRPHIEAAKEAGRSRETVFANSYVWAK